MLRQHKDGWLQSREPVFTRLLTERNVCKRLYADKTLIILPGEMLDASVIKRECQACGKTLHGRADKKFCNDYCRNAYNNNVKASASPLVRHINHILLKNRRILEAALGNEEMQKISREKLLEQGLQFRFITHTYTNKKGNTYFFCYEYGYLPLEHDWYLLVKRKEV